MLAIRMQRNGRTHLPVYRIVVQESQRHPLSGRVRKNQPKEEPVEAEA